MAERTPRTPAHLEDHLGYWLRLVSNHVSTTFAATLHEQQISVAEWVTLRYLAEHQAATPAQLADWSGMTRGAMSKVIAKLERKDLAASHPDPVDHRSRTLALTEEGQALVPALVAIADRNDARFFDGLTEADRQHLKELLVKVANQHGWTDVPID